jgi:hypothetical protein
MRLSSSYEGRFGSPRLLHYVEAGDPVENFQGRFEVIATPRPPYRPGVAKVADESRQSSRKSTVKMVACDEYRSDPRRAGCRTRNPGIIPGTRTAALEDFTPCRYANGEDYRPGKIYSDAFASPGSPRNAAGSPRNRENVGETAKTLLQSQAFQPGGVPNPLNDRKLSVCSRRAPEAPVPSRFLKKANDRTCRLHALCREDDDEGQPSPQRAVSPSVPPFHTQADFGLLRGRQESTWRSKPGFLRNARSASPVDQSVRHRAFVEGMSNCGSIDLLHHPSNEGNSKRSELRAHKMERADSTFEITRADARRASVASQKCGALFSARGAASLGVINLFD